MISDICPTLQRWEESRAPTPHSWNGANWTCQGMARLSLLAKTDKRLWLPFIPTDNQTSHPAARTQVGKSLPPTVDHRVKMTPGSGPAAVLSQQRGFVLLW